MSFGEDVENEEHAIYYCDVERCGRWLLKSVRAYLNEGVPS
jgi:hypothetical protein